MQPIVATYHDGVFAPEQPVKFPDGTRVNLWVVPESEDVEHLSDKDRAFLLELTERRKQVFQRLAQ
jgi:predicted DNA-binding antitoxin AbrB/MazE fold protein